MKVGDNFCSKRHKVLASAHKKPPSVRYARALLPTLYRHTHGRPFGKQVWRSWLKAKLKGRGWSVPSVEETGRLLEALARSRRVGDELHGPAGTWKSQGLRYADQEGSAEVANVLGFARHRSSAKGSNLISWHEYGNTFRLHRSEQRDSYRVSVAPTFKRLTYAVAKRTVEVTGSGAFPGSVVLDPRGSSLKENTPRYTLIYLHSFSSKGSEYLNFPHYFTIANAAVRVVLPTAPMMEQTCFEDWNVWRGKALGWRRIKFTSWFDYLTDKGGLGENHICIASLLEMRERIHALIRHEVQRVGDAKHVIIGGASQGCCVALDAAMTYPEELGGVIGVVGHLLGSTPMDPAKKKMPLHLFHEASDQEMRWRWVKDTVQRLVDQGFNVFSKREPDPTGSGHWIQEIEGDWVRGALRKIIFGDRH